MLLHTTNCIFILLAPGDSLAIFTPNYSGADIAHQNKQFSCPTLRQYARKLGLTITLLSTSDESKTFFPITLLEDLAVSL
jgi:hypothetical protein